MAAVLTEQLDICAKVYLKASAEGFDSHGAYTIWWQTLSKAFTVAYIAEIAMRAEAIRIIAEMEAEFG